MILFSRKHWFFYIILVTIFSTDIAVFLNIPVLRQILGFIFLVLLPGFLLLILLKPHGLKVTEQAILATGLSISFQYFFGIFINALLPLFNIDFPLNTENLLVSMNCVYLICLSIIWIRVSDPLNSFILPRLTQIDRVFLILPILLPALMISSIYILNITGYNLPIIGVICLIFIFLGCIAYVKPKHTLHIYPIFLIVIAFSFLAIFMLRFPHIWGNDVQIEYSQAFLTTLDLLHWQSTNSTLSNILSVTLLPTIFQSICNVSNLELFFKWIFVSICLTTPLAVFCIARKYFVDHYAFFAAVLYITQFGYLITAGNTRTNIAIMFCALTVFVLFCDNLDNFQKGCLETIFIFSVIVSHYATAYIFFLLLLCVLVMSRSILLKINFPVKISFVFVIVFFVGIFLWYFQLTEGSLFQRGVTFIDSILNSLDTLLSSEYQITGEASQLFSPTFKNQILSLIHWIVVWSTLALIGIGVIWSIIQHKSYLRLSNHSEKQPLFIKRKIDPELVCIALTSIGILASMTIFKVISQGYDNSRLFSLASITFFIFFIIGVLSLENMLKNGLQYANISFSYSHAGMYIIVALIILYGLFTLGIPYQISGISQYHLDNEDNTYKWRNLHDSEGAAAIWIKDESDEGTEIFVPGYTAASLTTLGRIPPDRINRGERLFYAKNPNERYLFFASLDIEQDYYIREDIDPIFKISRIDNQNKIYSNKGAEFYLIR